MLIIAEDEEPEPLVLSRRENLFIVCEWSAEHMVVGGPIERPRGFERLVRVIEALAVGCKDESAQDSAWQLVGDLCARAGVEQPESSCPLSSFFDLV